MDVAYPVFADGAGVIDLIDDFGGFRPGSSEELIRAVAMPGQTGREPWERHQASSAVYDCFLGEIRQ